MCVMKYKLQGDVKVGLEHTECGIPPPTLVSLSKSFVQYSRWR